MKLARLAALMTCTAVLVGPLGCSSENGQTPSAGGSPGAGGATAEAGAAEAGDGPSNGGAPDTDDVSPGWSVTASTCAEKLTPQRMQGTLLSLLLQPVLAGEPFVFGDPNPLADGSAVIPLNFRFYISEVELLRNDGDAVAVDVVTAAGEPEPYGVHLFNAEDTDSGTLRVLAPAGDYTGLRFALGIKLACNKQTPANLDDPLDTASQMTWPHGGGFLYFRYEGRSSVADSGAAGASGAAGTNAASEVPPAVHMGGNLVTEFVPHVTVSGALSVPRSGTAERELTVAMDEVFKGANSDIDVSDFAVGFRSTPEAVAGERLRRELPELHVFELKP